MDEKLPYRADVNGRSVELFADYDAGEEYIQNHPDVDPTAVCLLAIAMFHTRREHDYIAATYTDDDGEEQWVRDFDKQELLIWMGGVALDDDRKLLRLAEGENGSFDDQYGWRPPVIIEYAPNESERESYINHELQDLEACDGLPPEFLTEGL